MPAETIGSRLLACRTEIELSARGLHQRSGVAVPLIDALEADEPGARARLRGMDLVRLCKALGCSGDWLREGGS